MSRSSGWRCSLDAYVGYVEENFAGYTSLVRGAASGDEDLQRIYEEAQTALTERIFDEAGDADGTARGLLEVFTIEDTPAVRLMVRGWSAMTEDGRHRLGPRPAGRPRGGLARRPAGDARGRAARRARPARPADAGRPAEPALARCRVRVRPVVRKRQIRWDLGGG